MTRDGLRLELALDRLEGTMMVDVSAHASASARALMAGTRLPPLPTTIAAASGHRVVAEALALPGSLARWWLAPLTLAMIDVSPEVVAATAPDDGGWASLRALAIARDGAARRLMATPFLPLAHRLFGVPVDLVFDAAPLPPRDPAWAQAGLLPALDDVTLRQLWQRILPAVSSTAWHIAPHAEGWTYVVRPHHEVVSLLPLGATSPAGWAHALHELGHALVGVAIGAVSRVVDEAAAMQVAGWLAQLSPAAAAIAHGHARSLAFAHHLAAVEHALYAAATFNPPGYAPPPALRVDPGAQAAYVAAAALDWQVTPFDGAGLLARVVASAT